jgi:ribonuclease HII
MWLSARRSFFFFRILWDDFFMRWVVGIDEVGRGALAGPVVVAAAAMPRRTIVRSRALGKLKDSKKLSAKKREAWWAIFKDRSAVAFSLARVYPRQIEKRNITNAANVAAERAYGRLLRDRAIGPRTPVFLDGGLFLGNRRGRPARTVKTVINGDERITAIKVASIIAKVHRDQFMRRLAARHPAYGFEVHKGYGTEAHRAAISRRGPCPAHRLTFIKKSSIIRTYAHGRSTGKASFKGQSRSAPLASRDEKAAPFRL